MLMYFIYFEVQLLYLLLIGRGYYWHYKKGNLRRLAVVSPSVPLADGLIVLIFIVNSALFARGAFGVGVDSHHEELISFVMFCISGVIAIRRTNEEIKSLESKINREVKA
jgi:hypothetical protein